MPATPNTVYLESYQPSDYRISHTEMEIHLDFQATLVHTKHRVQRTNPQASILALDCENMQIEHVAINDKTLGTTEYQCKNNQLLIRCDFEQFEITIHNQINPANNTTLNGLYQSAEMLCTQCEAEGFRRITPSIDRPDNLSIFTVKLIADKSYFPVLLSNGNLIEQGEENNKSYAIWHDPFPKPTYLFAIVAGNLNYIEDSFVTRSGRQVALKFFARSNDVNKCHYSMDALKRSMHWDEQIYGREYDLDCFNVVAVSDFNMGAMENKGLNIFNTKYVLADRESATDSDYMDIESVIGHEYFHNWSGNRVTCRDWFQLSLKEGFTVFRDQEFSADMGSRDVKRIDDVNILRNAQFGEDAGPLAHPVQPQSYQQIDNFYTVTIYNKGAEVVRMQHTLLGSEKFRQATDLYFDRFDGQAVTTNDFVSCMEQVGEIDLTQFKRWYTQAGTPHIKVIGKYNSKDKNYTIKLSQSTPNLTIEHNNQPFFIPLKFALLGPNGSKFSLNGQTEKILILDTWSKSFVFNNIEQPPTPSLLRQFSAPVVLDIDLSDAQLIHLLRYDDDAFVRWESAQQLYTKYLLTAISDAANDVDFSFPETIDTLFVELLTQQSTDKSFTAKLLKLPDVKYLSGQCSPIDPALIDKVYRLFRTKIARSNKQQLQNCYQQCNQQNAGEFTDIEVANRQLRDTCLDYLSILDDDDIRAMSEQQLRSAKCMTDKTSALTVIARSQRPDKQSLLEAFYQQWQNDALIVDKWLRIQATVSDGDTLKNVIKLSQHDAFDSHNPNKIYSLILAFTHGNQICFHNPNGSGYRFATEWIKTLDKTNPQVAARLASCFNGYKKYTLELQQLMREQLNLLAEHPRLSRNVREIIEKSLL